MRFVNFDGYGPDGRRRFFKGGNNDGGAEEQRKLEAQRQQRIADETNLVNQVFSGGPARSRGTGNRITDMRDLDYFANNQSYGKPFTLFTADGTPIAFPANSFPHGKIKDISDALLDSNTPQARAAAAINGGGLYWEKVDQPESTGFDDKYFSNIADQYLAYAMPQFQEQISAARRELPYQFASTDSAEYIRKKAELERDAERSAADIAGQATDFSNKQRAQVESNRADLTGMIASGADAASVLQSANARAAALAKPPQFSPLADLFQKYTQAASYNPNLIGAAPGQPLYFGSKNAYPTSSGSAVRVVGG